MYVEIREEILSHLAVRDCSLRRLEYGYMAKGVEALQRETTG
jgi:hypothetical protein